MVLVMIELATVGELRSLKTELASRWDFSGSGIERDFLFWARKSRKNPEWKIPKSRGSGSGFENPEKA